MRAVLSMSGLVMLAGLALAASSPPAVAQAMRQGGAPAGTLGGYDDPFWGRRGDVICRRWCLSDRNPCDTVQQKAADDRCAGDIRTFYGVLRCHVGGDPNPQCP